MQATTPQSLSSHSRSKLRFVLVPGLVPNTKVLTGITSTDDVLIETSRKRIVYFITGIDIRQDSAILLVLVCHGLNEYLGMPLEPVVG